MRTVLFDIDGTLLMTNGGGSSALRLAMKQVFELENPCLQIEFSGRTDRSILAELLRINGLSDTYPHQQRLRQRYVELFPDVLRNCGGWLLPGVPELLERLSREARIRSYVMTGNLVETAGHKLGHFGLQSYFRGIFGGEHDAHRNCLARRTAKTIRERYGDAALDDLIVVGDTIADIECGHAIGAKVIAVCTGTDNRVKLEGASPLAVHDDLADTERLLDLITLCT